MEDLSLHVLDITENAIRAGATRVTVKVIRDTEANSLVLEIEDDGSGMDEETVRRALSPFYTSKPGKRFGLGVPLLKQAAEDCEGSFMLDSNPGGGTTILARFRLDHPDMKPLGDMEGTVMLLQAAHPSISFTYTANGG